ncbi:unnamed protein product [Macrosiphum euphorbiae]|uniref:Uncharacterized protein n=1 Tax=Macrosiphum euphorbiae TaxID=13131 RepID=A0AAV0WU77_9HEMI|nr:unnamed protein product [Macrosiphum euphorbiae]
MDQRGMEKYRIRNSIKRESKKSKETFLDSIFTELNVQLKSGQMNKAYRIVQKIFRDRKIKLTCIKRKKWRDSVSRTRNSEGKDRAILKEEFEKALNKLKDRNASGVDKMPAEFIKKQWRKHQEYILYELV